MMPNNKNKVRLLLISGGSLVGHNILDALADRRHEVHLIATNSRAEALSLYDFDTVYLTPTTLGDPMAFETRIMDVIAQEQPDLVIPCRDDDILFLAELGVRRPSRGGAPIRDPRVAQPYPDRA